MDCDEIIKVKKKLENLHNLMSRTIPTHSLSKHPFTFYNERFSTILEAIDKQINLSVAEIKDIETTNKELRETINKYRASLNESLKDNNDRFDIEFTDICKNNENETFENITVQKDFLENTLKKYEIKMERLKSEISSIFKQINEIKSWLGTGFSNENEHIKKLCENLTDDISMNNLENLKTVNLELQKIKEEKEKKRIKYYKIIVNGLDEMKFKTEDEIFAKIRNNYEDVTISDLYLKYKFIISEKKSRYEKVHKLVDRIRHLERIVREYFTFDNDLCEDITDKNISKLVEFKKILEKEEEKHFETIFQMTLKELEDVCNIFGMPMVPIEKNRENLDLMRKIIDELNMKKSSFLNCISLIEKRDELKEKMLEFEKLASDPRRLFRSSFQLIHEEKFRKNAVPNLLKLEHELLEAIEEYEEMYGEFVYKNENYRNILENEVKNRIINKTIFLIHKTDSPRKKTK